MAKRGSRLSKRVKRKRTLKPVGYWKLPKTGSLPPSEVLAQLKKKPLDYGRYARTKNGDK